MDEATLQSLLTALSATPDNRTLRALVLKSLLGLDQAERAHALLAGYAAADFADDERQLAARVCLAAGEAGEALAYADGDSPEALHLRARALLALGRRPEAHTAYRAAVAGNPTLEDPDLEAQLTAKVREFPGGENRPRLTVIANDDTDKTDLARLLRPEPRRVTFADVGGLDEIKKQITKKIILPFQKPSLFERFKKRVGGGILMYGPPGCGKTLLARATAGECQAEFYNIAISDVLDMYIGESERKLHALFEEARAHPPAVVFFDELEALGGKRQYSREGTSSKLVSQFLAEMDGYAQNNQGMLILGATNVPWAIDPAFRRPGRFDRVLFVPPPDREARRSILELLLAHRPLGEEIDAGWLAQHTQGFSGADLEAVVESGVDEAIEESLEAGREVPVTNAHLRAALKQAKPTTLEWLTTARNYAKYANEGGQYDEVLDFLKRHGKG
jgi:transitional endoplasmic reticulum ATPase